MSPRNPKKPSASCMACGCIISSLKDAKTHPRLGTLECGRCLHTYGDGDFSRIDSGVDENGDDNYCRWCTDGGSLFLCATPGCHNGFCDNCITRNLGQDKYTEISNNEEWSCFVCRPFQLDLLIKSTKESIEQLKIKDRDTSSKRASTSASVSKVKKNKSMTSSTPAKKAIETFEIPLDKTAKGSHSQSFAGSQTAKPTTISQAKSFNGSQAKPASESQSNSIHSSQDKSNLEPQVETTTELQTKLASKAQVEPDKEPQPNQASVLQINPTIDSQTNSAAESQTKPAGKTQNKTTGDLLLSSAPFNPEPLTPQQIRASKKPFRQSHIPKTDQPRPTLSSAARNILNKSLQSKSKKLEPSPTITKNKPATSGVKGINRVTKASNSSFNTYSSGVEIIEPEPDLFGPSITPRRKSLSSKSEPASGSKISQPVHDLSGSIGISSRKSTSNKVELSSGPKIIEHESDLFGPSATPSRKAASSKSELEDRPKIIDIYQKKIDLTHEKSGQTTNVKNQTPTNSASVVDKKGQFDNLKNILTNITRKSVKPDSPRESSKPLQEKRDLMTDKTPSKDVAVPPLRLSFNEDLVQWSPVVQQNVERAPLRPTQANPMSIFSNSKFVREKARSSKLDGDRQTTTTTLATSSLPTISSGVVVEEKKQDIASSSTISTRVTSEESIRIQTLSETNVNEKKVDEKVDKQEVKTLELATSSEKDKKIEKNDDGSSELQSKMVQKGKSSIGNGFVTKKQSVSKVPTKISTEKLPVAMAPTPSTTTSIKTVASIASASPLSSSSSSAKIKTLSEPRKPLMVAGISVDIFGDIAGANKKAPDLSIVDAGVIVPEEVSKEEVDNNSMPPNNKPEVSEPLLKEHITDSTSTIVESATVKSADQSKATDENAEQISNPSPPSRQLDYLFLSASTALDDIKRTIRNLQIVAEQMEKGLDNKCIDSIVNSSKNANIEYSRIDETLRPKCTVVNQILGLYLNQKPLNKSSKTTHKRKMAFKDIPNSKKTKM